MKVVVPIKKVIILRKELEHIETKTNGLIVSEVCRDRWFVEAAGSDCDGCYNKGDELFIYSTPFKFPAEFGKDLYYTSEDNVLGFIKEDKDE